MKTFTGVAAVVCIGIFVFQACSYGGPGGGTPECQAQCLKNEQCCAADQYCDPWDEYKREECLCECGNFYKMMTDDIVRGLKECNNLPCEGESRSMCIDSLLTSCLSELTPAVEAFCTRIVDCSVDTSFEECAQMFNSYMGCYNSRYHATMVTCSSVGTCETFQDEFEVCMMGTLRVVECDPVDY